MTNPDLKRRFSPLVEIFRVEIQFGTLWPRNRIILNLVKHLMASSLGVDFLDLFRESNNNFINKVKGTLAPEHG